MKPTPLQHWPQLLERLEKGVVEGQHMDVKQALQRLNPNHVPREFAAPLAEIAWRISEPLMTLKLLNKILFPENELATVPTDHEKIIYATALGNLGAVDEALKIFDSIDSRKESEVWLRKALAQFRVWNYPGAIPNLENFLAQKDLAPYRYLIGQVNLAAALVTDGQYEKADRLLVEIQNVCTKNNYLLLLGNCFELQGQSYFFRQDYTSALSCLNQAIELLKNQEGEFYLYAEKWKLICETFQNPDPTHIASLKALNEKALSGGYWEIVRECDLFEAIVTGNEELSRKVIMGTPYEFYRQRARRLLGQNILPQGQFELSLNIESQTSNQVFVFDPYEKQNLGEALFSKPMLLAMFEALTFDFYKPSHIGLLFQRIYKDEKFNPFSSPKRVLSLIKRLDEWFEQQHVPLRVRMKKSEFALIAKDSQAVKILIKRAKVLSKFDGNLSSLREHFKDRSFSSQHVALKMNISRSSAQGLINQALEEGLIAKRGQGRGTTYALVARNRKKVAA